jgi:DNA-binding Lrp family transcriptional regulator
MIKIDAKDRVIITMLAKNPNASQDEIAKEVKLSQPSVAIRIRKLRESGVLENQIGINPLKIGMYLAKVDVSSTNPSEILRMFKDCPYFANGFTISGRNNLCLLFFSESVATLEAIVNGHIRSNPLVTDVDFNIVITAEKPYIVPTVLSPEHSDLPPCGMLSNCTDCHAFKDKKCMGCPATGQYQGWFY